MSATAHAHSTTAAPHTRVKDALDHARAAAQELHGALSDAAAKRGGAIKADLEAIPHKARAIADSLKASLDGKRCPMALVPTPIGTVLDCPVSEGFELSLWTTLMTTRRLGSGALRF